MEKDRPLLTTRQQLADELGISLVTVDNMVATGEGPPTVKVGRRRYFMDVEAWLRARMAKQAAAKARAQAEKAEMEAQEAEAAARQARA